MQVLLVGALAAMLGTSVIATTPAPIDVGQPTTDSPGPIATSGVSKAMAPTPLAKPEPEPEPAEPEEPAEPTPEERAEDWEVDVADWVRLADCESGDWDADGEPQRGSARWRYGVNFDHGDIFEGGLNFHPDTWESFRDPDMPGHAGRASRWEEMEVAERVLDEQGWNAWPVCSRKVDLAE